MIKNPEPYLITAGGKIRCRRCTGTSRRSQKQCKHPALKSSATSKCKWHGGASRKGAHSEKGKKAIAQAHTIHGNETRNLRSERSEKSAMFQYLRDIGDSVGMFNGSHTRGRKPSTYTKYNMSDTEQLDKAIIKTLKIT